MHRGRQDFYCYFWVSGQDNGHVTFLYSFERHESWSPRHSVHDNTMRATVGFCAFETLQTLHLQKDFIIYYFLYPLAAVLLLDCRTHFVVPKGYVSQKLTGILRTVCNALSYEIYILIYNKKLQIKKKKKQNQGLEYKHTYRQDKMLLPFRL